MAMVVARSPRQRHAGLEAERGLECGRFEANGLRARRRDSSFAARRLVAWQWVPVVTGRAIAERGVATRLP